MSAAVFEHALPWTEEEFFAAGETGQRIELYDGCLFLSPTPTPSHQNVPMLLRLALATAVTTAGLNAHQAVNVRLRIGRIAIPDLVIVEPVDATELVVDATRVRLVAEIVATTTAAHDRVLKMHYYAEAGIPFYLLVEQEPLRLRLFRLDGGHYVSHAEAEAGTPLRIEEPVHVEIDPAALG